MQAIETHKCHATQPNTRQPPAQLTLVQAVDTVLLGLRRGGQVPDHHVQQRVGGGQERLHHALHQGLANQLLVLGLELLQHLRQCEGRGQGGSIVFDRLGNTLSLLTLVVPSLNGRPLRESPKSLFCFKVLFQTCALLNGS